MSGATGVQCLIGFESASFFGEHLPVTPFAADPCVNSHQVRLVMALFATHAAPPWHKARNGHRWFSIP